MLNENDTTLENIIHLFSHQNFTFPNRIASQALKAIEKNMSTLEISESDPLPNQLENSTKDMPSTSIGARIMRHLRRNSTSSEETKSNITLKKKNLNSKAIEKIYMNKTLGRLKHTQLETIFEHDEETDANENFTIDEKQVFGKRKIKRCVSYTDGLKPSKTVKQKRKRRIQKIFGVHKKIKPISMKKFLERLQANDAVDITAKSAIVGV